ncbi:membrane protein [Colletotrichum musicola]|uniref:Membrane protein n=1 Tax=Colletotrichum musicola TaxID=2175873 RepID=A0A8H6IUD6_9PEZI|nr:membrane protein [Colletotrichum musicola]
MVYTDEESDVMDTHNLSDSEPMQPRRDGPKRPQRHANLYDAVAGRVTYETTLSSFESREKAPTMAPKPPKLIKHSVRPSTLAPEEALFRRKAAPERFAEFDVYMAHDRNLPDGGRGSLPDSDLLKAVHSYSSHFYAALGGEERRAMYQVGSRNIDERSMDESALLAFGILLEEAGKDVLGDKGDMVFTEGLDTDDADVDPTLAARSDADDPTQPMPTIASLRPYAPVGFADRGSWKRAPKRRKVMDPDEDA